MNKLIKKTLFLSIVLFSITIFFVFLHEYFLIQPKLVKSLQNFNIDNLYIIPLKIVFTVLSITLISYFVYFSFNLKVTFLKILISIIKAQFVFLLSILFEIFHFKIIQPNNTLNDVSSFSSLSVLSLLNYKDIEPWFIYPLQTLNLFEILFVLLFTYFLTKENQVNFIKNLKTISATYFCLMFLWMVFSVFIVLNNS